MKIAEVPMIRALFRYRTFLGPCPRPPPSVPQGQQRDAYASLQSMPLIVPWLLEDYRQFKLRHPDTPTLTERVPDPRRCPRYRVSTWDPDAAVDYVPTLSALRDPDVLLALFTQLYPQAAEVVLGVYADVQRWGRLMKRERTELIYKIGLKLGFAEGLTADDLSKGYRHGTGVRQGNWFSVGIGPVAKATQ